MSKYEESSIVLVYQKALEMLRRESNQLVLNTIKRDHKIAEAMISSLDFRITAVKKVTQKDLEMHIMGFGMTWGEIKPYLDKALVYWMNLGKERRLKQIEQTTTN